MKYIKRICLGLIGLYLLVLGIDIYISNIFLRTRIYGGELQVYNDIVKHKKKYDILIYGSSRAMVGFNPNIIKNYTNLETYNCGYNARKIHLQFLRHIIVKQNLEKPKNILLSLDSFSLDYSNEIYDDILPLLLFNKELESNIKGIGLLDIYVPLYRYLSDEKYIKFYIKVLKYNFTNKNDSEKIIRINGFGPRNLKWKDENYDLHNQNYKIDKDKSKYLYEIVEYCKDANINLILVYSPIYKKGREKDINHSNIVDYYRKIARDNNILFMDYSYDSISEEKNLFYNSIHLNTKGADVFTKKLVEDIRPYIKY